MSRIRIGRVAAVFAAAFVIATAAAAGVLSLTLSNDPPPVHVRWKAGTTDDQRVELEHRYGLVRGEFREGTTYAYRLSNTSSDNIRALVHDPRVDDTNDINRIRYRPSFANDRQRRLIFYSVVGGAIISVLMMLRPQTWKKFGLLGN